MGGEKFIRQLPLVIAIILMISNCQSANDSYNGDDGSGGGSATGMNGGGGSGYGSSDSSGSGGLTGGYMGPSAGMTSASSDPSDGVVVQLPQQISGQWQMVSTKLSTVTKYDIYTRLSSYYGDVSRSTNLQSQMITNRAAMTMGMMPSGGGMMVGGGMSPMPSMMTPNVQAAQMAQAAQMSAVQLQQRVQMLMQQLYMVQMQNQQLQMQVQSDRSQGFGDDEDMDDGSDRVSLSKEEEKAQQALKEMATILGVEEGEDLPSVLEERLRKDPEDKGDWEEKYKDLADKIPTQRGETVEEALERLINASEQEERAVSGEEAEEAEESVVASSAPVKRSLKSSAPRVLESEEPVEPAEIGDAEALEEDGAGDGDREHEETTEIERPVFVMKDAPSSLTETQKRQLLLWREKRQDLEKMAKCPHKDHAFSEAEEWAFLKQAFAFLKRFAKCA